MTRWNFDDLAGRLLAEMEAGRERGEVVSLPADAEDSDLLSRAPGTMLWDDDDYGYARQLSHEKTVQSARNWSALYQQRPLISVANWPTHVVNGATFTLQYDLRHDLYRSLTARHCGCG